MRHEGLGVDGQCGTLPPHVFVSLQKTRSMSLLLRLLLGAQVNRGSDLAHEVGRWQAKDGSVLITTYTVFRANVLHSNEAEQQQQQQEEGEGEAGDSASLAGDAASREAMRHALLHGASIVVADEAHELRNENTLVRTQP
jgi:hypothetical protein